MTEWLSAKRGIFLFIVGAGTVGPLLWPVSSLAWYDHRYITPLMWTVNPSNSENPANSPGNNPGNSNDNRLTQILNTRVRSVCADESAKIYAALAEELQLNPKAEILSYSKVICAPDSDDTSIADIVAGLAIDDPDQKMDQDLPAAFDPGNERKWMGGTEGVAGQAFRHMFFAGWDWHSPLATFQIPAQPTGQAPVRLNLMAQRAKKMLRDGNIEWGIRLLVWAMHYAQDMTQPFHISEFPSPRMLAWYELISWPPSGAYDRAVAESIIITRNFHWAYEGYVRNQFMHPTLLPYGDCLSRPESKDGLGIPEGKFLAPAELAIKITEASRNLSAPLGKALHRFFGNQLNRKGYDLSKQPDHPDYDDYATRPDLIDERTAIHELTCQALANASSASRQLLHWAFEP